MEESHPFPVPPPTLGDEDLAIVEEHFQKALRERSVDHLRVFGFGEISVAVGYPIDHPTAVLKRLPPNRDSAHADFQLSLIEDFRDSIVRRGGRIVPTEIRGFLRDDGLIVPYIIQPVIPKEMLADTVIATDEPTVDHPILLALYDYVMQVGDNRLTIDSQITNFAWHDDQLWLHDMSTPHTYDALGKYDGDFSTGFQALPAVLKPLLQKEVAHIFEYYLSPTGALTQTAVFLKRIDADDWVQPALETFNARLDTPIEINEVNALYAKQLKEFPRLKQLARIQRAWQTHVRRKPYEILITNSFSGEIL